MMERTASEGYIPPVQHEEKFWWSVRSWVNREAFVTEIEVAKPDCTIYSQQWTLAFRSGEWMELNNDMRHRPGVFVDRLMFHIVRYLQEPVLKAVGVNIPAYKIAEALLTEERSKWARMWENHCPKCAIAVIIKEVRHGE